MVDIASLLDIHGNGQAANITHVRLGTKNPLDRADGVSANYGPGAHEPTLFHKVKNQKSILTLVVSESKIYAGTQDGELKVWHLYSYRGGTAKWSA